MSAPFPVRPPMQPSPAMHQPGTGATAMPVPAPTAAAVRRRPPAAGDRAPARAVDERALCARCLAGDTVAWNALIARRRPSRRRLAPRARRADRPGEGHRARGVDAPRRAAARRAAHAPAAPGLAVAQAAFLSLEAARRDGARAASRQLDGEAGRIATKWCDPAADAETRLLTSERVERAEQVLATFAPNARDVFRLTYGGDGLSHADVAEKRRAIARSACGESYPRCGKSSARRSKARVMSEPSTHRGRRQAPRDERRARPLRHRRRSTRRAGSPWRATCSVCEECAGRPRARSERRGGVRGRSRRLANERAEIAPGNDAIGSRRSLPSSLRRLCGGSRVTSVGRAGAAGPVDRRGARGGGGDGARASRRRRPAPSPRAQLDARALRDARDMHGAVLGE